MRLSELRSAMKRYATRFDPDVLSVPDAERVSAGPRGCAAAFPHDRRRSTPATRSLAAVVTKGENVGGVAHRGRRPNAHQQSALHWLYPTCAVEGCNSLTFLEFDHRHDWFDTHMTVFDLLDRLCSHHHRLKTTAGWGLVDGRGKRAFVPPDDPRHPRHAERHAAA